MPLSIEERFPYPRNIGEIERANDYAGFHFFDRDTLRFFKSRVSENVYGGRYFVTSENDGTRGRRYTVRASQPSGDIRTVGAFYELTRSAAHTLAKRCADVGEDQALENV